MTHLMMRRRRRPARCPGPAHRARAAEVGTFERVTTKAVARIPTRRPRPAPQNLHAQYMEFIEGDALDRYFYLPSFAHA